MSWIIAPIIIIIIITFLWLWLLRQIFNHSNKKKIFFTSITSIIGVIVITIIYNTWRILHLDQSHIVIVYSSIILICGFIYLQYQRLSWWISQSILWITIALIWWSSWVYSIAALGEESFKWIYIKKFISWLLWEVILLWIVSGLVFWWTENIVYIIQYIINNATNNELILMLQQRGLLPLIIHIWSICISLIIGYNLKKRMYPFIARSIGIASW
jgi:hypothetical protein